VLLISKQKTPEPRLALSPRGPAVYGIDLDQLAPNHDAIVDDSAVGYPKSLSALPPGDYFVEAVVNIYEQVHRSDGHTIWVHMNDGRVEFFNFAAGNLYSDVMPVHIGDGSTLHLTVNHVIPPAKKPVDTEWLKHVQIQSQMLRSSFRSVTAPSRSGSLRIHRRREMAGSATPSRCGGVPASTSIADSKTVTTSTRSGRRMDSHASLPSRWSK